jgi:hypothetical protein
MFFYYIVCEFVEQNCFEVNVTKLSLEISLTEEISEISVLERIATRIMKENHKKTKPIITFYHLLRKE